MTATSIFYSPETNMIWQIDWFQVLFSSVSGPGWPLKLELITGPGIESEEIGGDFAAKEFFIQMRRISADSNLFLK